MNPKSKTVVVPKTVAVNVDKRSKTRNIALPFMFPDNTAGALVICHLNTEPWHPEREIESITITFKL